jgi:hypothetical protein
MNARIKDGTATQSMQMAVFKVNDDLRIEGASITDDHLFASYSTSVLHKRLGEALQCTHSFDSEEGCGFSSACPNCAVRHAVLECLLSGAVIRKRLEMNLRRNDLRSWHKFIITANRVTDSGKRFVALIVEDLHSTLLNEKLPLHIDDSDSGTECLYHDIIKDHLIKYRTVTFQPLASN